MNFFKKIDEAITGTLEYMDKKVDSISKSNYELNVVGKILAIPFILLIVILFIPILISLISIIGLGFAIVLITIMFNKKKKPCSGSEVKKEEDIIPTFASRTEKTRKR